MVQTATALPTLSVRRLSSAMFKFQNKQNPDAGDDGSVNAQFDRQTVVVIIIVVETFFLVVTTIWSYFGQVDLRPLFHFNLTALLWGLSAGLAISASNLALLYLSQKFASKIFAVDARFIEARNDAPFWPSDLCR